MVDDILESTHYGNGRRLYEVVFTSLGHKAKSKSYFGRCRDTCCTLAEFAPIVEILKFCLFVCWNFLNGF